MPTIYKQRHKDDNDSLKHLVDINRKLEQDQELGQAFHYIRTLIDGLHQCSYREQFEQLEANYQLMCDFMLNGYKDSNVPHFTTVS